MLRATGSILCCALLAGCGNQAADPGGTPSPPSPVNPSLNPPAVPAEWTIMVYLNADNNLERFGIQDFREMAKIGSDDKVNVVVQFDRTPEETNECGDWTQALRFRVEKGMEPTTANAIEDLGEVDMGDKNVLAAFVEWAKLRYQAKRYMLIIWNHGQGWRAPNRVAYSRVVRSEFFLKAGGVSRKPDDIVREAHVWSMAHKFEGLEEITDMQGVLAVSLAAQKAFRQRGLEIVARGSRRAEEVDVVPVNLGSPGSVRYVSTDDTSQTFLYNRAVQQALEDQLGEERLDLVGFDACLMAMVETAYALRRSADVMVGSQELEPGTGWKYDEWLAELVATPTMSGADLGKVIVKTYEVFYRKLLPDTTLSAIDLAKLDTFAGEISAFADVLATNLAVELRAIQTARGECYPYAPGYGLHGVDLGRFCEQIEAASTNQELRQRASGLRTTLKGVVLENYAGADRQGKFGSTGIAIYFPESRNAYLNDLDHDGYEKSNTVAPVQFVQDHRWADFLHAYFAMTPYWPER